MAINMPSFNGYYNTTGVYNLLQPSVTYSTSSQIMTYPQLVAPPKPDPTSVEWLREQVEEIAALGRAA